MNYKSHSLQNAEYDLGLDIQYVSDKNSYDFTKIHRHTYFEFILFEKGSGGKQTIDFKDYPIESESLYVIVPNQVHLMRRKPEENGILLQFTKEFLSNCIAPIQIDWLMQLCVSPKINLTSIQYQNLRDLILRLRTELNRKDRYRKPRVKHFFGFVFFEILEVLPTTMDINYKQNCALEFLMLVEKNIKEMKTVKEYADLIQTPINKLTFEVNKQFGKSPLKIIHDILLIEIKRLLVVEQLSHKEIAFQLQFDSQSSYSRFIKQKTTLTPGELKEQTMKIAQ